MERILCLAAGYVFGLFQTGYIYGKLNGVDIRKYGSGNLGSTNALRVLGARAGAVVFAGDVLKTLIPCAIVRILFSSRPEAAYAFMLYTGLGVTLGHNFPFYLNFKGGKGIAVMAALFAAVDWRLALVCFLVFAGIVGTTRFVSQGSLAIAAVFSIWNIVMGGTGAYGLSGGFYTEYCVLSLIITAMAFWRHRANIKRLLNGTENKVGAKKRDGNSDSQ